MPTSTLTLFDESSLRCISFTNLSQYLLYFGSRRHHSCNPHHQDGGSLKTIINITIIILTITTIIKMTAALKPSTNNNSHLHSSL